ncbi:purine and uridine phosphorylase [Xylaria venustula]|nr:purine and uridine phosphorylase [Xylaria venustula]
MASQARVRKVYTVGWVCALPIEQTAAIAMLDQEHDHLPQPPPNDHNTYTLGSIGSHNIVVACLPKGKIGTISAATVATQMINTFPSIKFSLMVGIGGGIPPKVRLGDIVVGTPSGKFPGVVQWDLGKQEQDKVETEHELEGSKIPAFLDEMVLNHPRLALKYLRSESFQDELFQASYDHKTSLPDHADEYSRDEGVEEEDTCRYCDRTQIAIRKPRDMSVHYGLIASSNSVIKNAAFRDNLYKDLEGDVLCVEMEAAGLVDSFLCLVIRGICDYADSHKNKVWLENAAALAAAYAKGLLGYILPSDVEREQAVKDLLSDIPSTFSSIRGDVTHSRSRLDREEKLCTDYLRRREGETGQWLLASQQYQDWIMDHNKTLFCPGIPGAGKTILTSVVIDDLEKRFRDDTTTALAYVYYNYKRQSEQGFESMLSSLLKQLAKSHSSLPHILKKLYSRHERSRTNPSFDELSHALELITAEYSRVFIIVDALDECSGLNNSNPSGFLLAQLHFTSLVGKDTPRAIREALQMLEMGSNTYYSAYDSAMQRIKAQPVGQAKREEQVLTQELQHALAVEPEVEDAVSLCAGLVTIDGESVFDSGYYKTDKEFEEQLTLYPLYAYAAHNWAYHARETSKNQYIIDFLLKAGQVEASFQVVRVPEFKYDGYSQSIATSTTGLHLVAYFGLDKVMETMFAGCDVDATDSHDWTPLYWAAQNGHEASVRLLLEADRISLDLEDKKDGRTPLSWAAVTLLLATTKIDLNSKDTKYGKTPLLWAAENGHDAIVNQLLAAGADPRIGNFYASTPLFWAKKNGHEAIARLLKEASRKRSHADSIDAISKRGRADI